VGIIKEAIKNAILDGKIPNERQAAINLMIDEASAIGLTVVKMPELTAPQPEQANEGEADDNGTTDVESAQANSSSDGV
jgi:hypothetical protein